MNKRQKGNTKLKALLFSMTFILLCGCSGNFDTKDTAELASVSENPTASPEELLIPSPSPIPPTAAPTASPSPTAEPTPSPEPTPKPTVAPKSTPVPTVTPKPTPAPTVAPKSAPVPTVAPKPAPEPARKNTPAPIPESTVETQPAPAQEQAAESTTQNPSAPEISNEVVAPEPQGTEITYVTNSETKKFHTLFCSRLPTTNRVDSSQSRDELINNGYSPCKICKP